MSVTRVQCDARPMQFYSHTIKPYQQHHCRHHVGNNVPSVWKCAPVNRQISSYYELPFCTPGPDETDNTDRRTVGPMVISLHNTVSQRARVTLTWWCVSGCVVECRTCNPEVAGSNLVPGYFTPKSTQPSILLRSVNEYQLRLGRQRQLWLIPLADETQGVQVKLWDPLTMRAIPEHLRYISCMGAIEIVITFTLETELDEMEKSNINMQYCANLDNSSQFFFQFFNWRHHSSIRLITGHFEAVR